VSGLPKLPTEISPDGREVWGWAHALSAEVQRRHTLREAADMLNKLGTRCGDCAKWMCKTCPREKSSMTGYSQGPSADATRCTNDYVEGRDIPRQRAELTARIESLQATTEPTP
jgi:hypothetical protein